MGGILGTETWLHPFSALRADPLCLLSPLDTSLQIQAAISRDGSLAQFMPNREATPLILALRAGNKHNMDCFTRPLVLI